MAWRGGRWVAAPLRRTRRRAGPGGVSLGKCGVSPGAVSFIQEPGKGRLGSVGAGVGVRYLESGGGSARRWRCALLGGVREPAGAGASLLPLRG